MPYRPKKADLGRLFKIVGGSQPFAERAGARLQKGPSPVRVMPSALCAAAMAQEIFLMIGQEVAVGVPIGMRHALPGR